MHHPTVTAASSSAGGPGSTPVQRRATWHTRALAARALLLLGAALAACAGTQPIPLGVDPAPAPARVAFRLGAGGGYFYGLTVTSCTRDSVMWTVGTGGTDAGRPSVIQYGIAPPGFATRQGPVALTPGCYRVSVGSGFTRFHLLTSGKVTRDST